MAAGAPPPPGPLTPEQVQHFRAFGFLLLRGYLAPGEVRTLQAEHTAALASAYGGAPATERQWVRMWGTGGASPAFEALPEDERFAAAAEQLYGPEIFCCYIEANKYSGDTSWHPDYAENYNAPGRR